MFDLICCLVMKCLVDSTQIRAGKIQLSFRIGPNTLIGVLHLPRTIDR